MSTYTGKSVTVPAPAATIADKFADMGKMSALLDKMPADQRQKIGDIRFTDSTMTMVNPTVGEIVFKITERSENGVNMMCTSPMKMELSFKLEPEGADKTRVTPSLDIDLPMMLRPLLGPQLQKAADQMGGMMGGMLSAQ